MALEMREACEKCAQHLGHRDEARICSYECTFCVSCSADMNGICPNCGGELVPRPKRNSKRDP